MALLGPFKKINPFYIALDASKSLNSADFLLLLPSRITNEVLQSEISLVQIVSLTAHFDASEDDSMYMSYSVSQVQYVYSTVWMYRRLYGEERWG